MDDHQGTIWRYKNGCRCPLCRQVASEHRAAERQAVRLRQGASERCLLCPWVGFNLASHETRRHAS